MFQPPAGAVSVAGLKCVSTIALSVPAVKWHTVIAGEIGADCTHQIAGPAVFVKSQPLIANDARACTA